MVAVGTVSSINTYSAILRSMHNQRFTLKPCKSMKIYTRSIRLMKWSIIGLWLQCLFLSILIADNTNAQNSGKKENFFMVELQQDITVTGRVTSEDEGEPLPGVNVIVEGTSTGTVTDVEGNYSIQVSEGQTLVFSFVGYETQRVQVENQDIINIILSSEPSQLDEVVVIGYGALERSRMTTSVSKLDDRTLKSAPRSNVGTALTGAIPGLRVQNVTGQPGESPNIVMRGGTSWSGEGSPLVLIDGVISSLYALNAEDIESIEVLKDAASTSIYGARAANGVILVTTKKGRTGDAQVRYSYKFGSNQPREGYEYLNAEDYIRLNRLAWKDYVELTGRTNFDTYILNPAVGWPATGNIDNSIYTTQYLTPENEFLLNEGWKRMRDPLFGQTVAGQDFLNEYIIFQDNKMSDLFFQNSYVHDHHLSIVGGSERSTYALGLGYMNDKGIVLGSGFERFTANLNADHKITDNIKVGSTVSFASSSLARTYIPSYTQIFQRHAGQPPTSRIYNADGTLNPGLNVGFGNPLYYQDKFIGDNLEQRLRSTVTLDWDLLPELRFTLSGSYFNIHNSNEYFDKAYYTGGNLVIDRNADAEYSRSQTMMGNAILDYNTTFFEDHTFNAMLGVEYYGFDVFNFEGGTRYSPTDMIPTLNVGAEPRFATSSQSANRLLSAFGRVNYDYQLKYLAQFNFRYDGSSKLGDNKWGFFPGISFGWNIHNEDFFEDIGLSSYISSIKPRISYGVNGNVEELSDFGVFGTYGLSPIYGGERGYYNTELPLLGLKWESSTTFNMGIDLGLFNERLNIKADYFIRDVKNKLAPYALPHWTGFASIDTNIGTLRNKGFETEINANIITSPEGLSWDVGVMAYTVKNYAIELPDNGLPKNRQGGTQIYDPASGEVYWVGGLQEGERVGLDIVLGHVQEYLYNTIEQVSEHDNRYDTYHFPENAYTRYPGNVAWRDVDGNDTIDYRDRVIQGRTTPNWMGGVTTSLSYKGLGLYVKADYAVGHMIYNLNRARGLSQVQGSQNSMVEQLNAWRPDNTDTDVPRFIFVDAFKDHGVRGQDDRVNSRYNEKADFLCLREVTLSYNLPGTVLRNFLGSLRMYLTGTNLIYFTKYTGNSPEEGGTDEGRFPLPRTFTLGVNVNF